MTWRVVTGDCVEAMRGLEGCSVDAVVTDPPYGLEFMGKEWDRLAGTPGYNERGRITDRPDAEVPYGRGGGVNSYQAGRPMQEWHQAWATEALRVLRPGGHLLAFGGTRTYHRLACAVEDAGFEIRDTICWLYGSGFPKSLNVSAQLSPVGEPMTPEAERWSGWGTALKPAHEPVVVARKPLSGTVASNVLEHGTGALNVDGCRIEGTFTSGWSKSGSKASENIAMSGPNYAREPKPDNEAGRWPANVVLDGEAARLLDEQTGEQRARGNVTPTRSGTGMFYDEPGEQGIDPGDSGGASRFFKVVGGRPRASEGAAADPGNPGGDSAAVAGQGGGLADDVRFRYCAKASRGERNAGLDGFEEKDMGEVFNGGMAGASIPLKGSPPPKYRNVHPTVKPIDLMRWLVRLVTPPGGTVLDPFAGSGTTGCAAVLEGFDFIGIEREPEYVAIAEARIGWWEKHRGTGDADEILSAARVRDEREGSGQVSFDWGEAA